MKNKELIAEHGQYILPTYNRLPITISHGKGAKLWDFEGKEYIDFSSGIGVNSIGHGNPKLVEAITNQAEKLTHVSNLYYTQPAVLLAKQLCARTGMQKAFFSNSGAESNEGLIKLARKYSLDKYGVGRANIITLEQSFHGRTITTLAATGQDVFHQHFFPFTEGFSHVPAGDIDALKQAADDSVCAVILELIQGEGGVCPLAKSYVTEVAAFCAEKDILLLIDEVQTGIGRTGTFFAFEQYDILPDAISFAKGIAAGVPFGGFLVNKSCEHVLGVGDHATTYGGNPLAAAAALVVLDTLTDDNLLEISAKGQYLQEKIRAFQSPYITEVRGAGLMIGVLLTDIAHRTLCETLGDKGLLALTAGSSTLRLLPPLTITYEEIDQGLEILKTTLDSF